MRLLERKESTMIRLLAIAITVSLLAACAAPMEKSADRKQLEIRCRTHATRASMTGEANEQLPYLECIHTKGTHAIEVLEEP